MASVDDAAYVKFGIKELLIQLDGKVDTLVQLVGQKADQTVVSALEQRMSSAETQLEHRSQSSHRNANKALELEKRILQLETGAAVNKGISDYKRWLLAGGALIGLEAVAGLIFFIMRVVQAANGGGL